MLIVAPFVMDAGTMLPIAPHKHGASLSSIARRMIAAALHRSATRIANKNDEKLRVGARVGSNSWFSCSWKKR